MDDFVESLRWAICAGPRAFTALTPQGAFCWGDAACGGGRWLPVLRKVRAASRAFAGITKEGHVVAWGGLAEDRKRLFFKAFRPFRGVFHTFSAL